MSELAPGFLVAAPPLGDPNFDRSVVLLAAHSNEGAFGWVINGQQLMTLSELLIKTKVAEGALDLKGVVRVGGPVAKEQVWLVYRAEDKLPDVEGQFEVGLGIVASASRQVLEAAAQNRVSAGLVGLAGYAGWGPSQLENEIRAGAWLPTDVDPRAVFDIPNEEIWQYAYERIGTTPMAFVSRTVGSA